MLDKKFWHPIEVSALCRSLEILYYKLMKLCFHGTRKVLSQTVTTQLEVCSYVIVCFNINIIINLNIHRNYKAQSLKNRPSSLPLLH